MRPTHGVDVLLGYTPETGVEGEVLAARQEREDGVKLRAVPQVLVYRRHVAKDTEGKGEMTV